MWDTDNLSPPSISSFCVFLLRDHLLDVLMLPTHFLEDFTPKTSEKATFPLVSAQCDVFREVLQAC